MAGFLRIDRLCGDARRVVTADGRVVLERCHVARRPAARLVGLLATRDLKPGEGVWLEPCASVHTAGMRFAVACAFLDADGRVLRVVDRLGPWRVAGARGARSVVEVRAGALAGVAVGDVLTLGG